MRFSEAFEDQGNFLGTPRDVIVPSIGIYDCKAGFLVFVVRKPRIQALLKSAQAPSPH